MRDIKSSLDGTITPAIVLIIVAALIPFLQAAFANMSAAGVPLAGLFASDGVLMTIYVVGVIYYAIKKFGGSNK